jgi:hypothetical protein
MTSYFAQNCQPVMLRNARVFAQKVEKANQTHQLETIGMKAFPQFISQCHIF